MDETTTFLCTSSTHAEQGLSMWADFTSQGFSTLLGAVLAFLFARVLYQKQKSQESMSYLLYAVSVLGQFSNELYPFKDEIGQPRYTEAVELEQVVSNSQNPHIQMDKTANFIFGGDFQLEVDLEKLAFLVKRNPNLIILLGTLINSVKTLNHIVIDINQELKMYRSQNQPLDRESVMLTFTKNKLLYRQLDDTIYLTEKANGLLIEFGQNEYGRKMKIKSLELTDEKYKALKPKPIESWEGYEWFPKKKRWWNKKK